MVWQILPLFNGFLIQHTVQTYTSVTNCIDLQASSLKKKPAIHKTNNIHIQCIPVGIQVKVTRHFWSLYHHWWHLKQKLESDGLTVWIYTLISSSCLIISHGKKRKQSAFLYHIDTSDRVGLNHEWHYMYIQLGVADYIKCDDADDG